MVTARGLVLDPNRVPRVPCRSVDGLRGILSPSTAASRKLAKLGGRIVAFESDGSLKPDRTIHRAILNACRQLRPWRGPALTRGVDPAL